MRRRSPSPRRIASPVIQSARASSISSWDAPDEVPPHDQLLLERLASQEHEARVGLGAQGEFGAAAAEVEHRAGQHAARRRPGPRRTWTAPRTRSPVPAAGVRRRRGRGRGRRRRGGCTSCRARPCPVEVPRMSVAVRPGAVTSGQLGVVLEARVGVAVAVRERDPELRAVQEAGVRPGALLGVADGPAGGHQAQLARADGLQAAGGVAVQDLALVEPADGLQAHVRMRRHLHAGLRRRCRRGRSGRRSTRRPPCAGPGWAAAGGLRWTRPA